MTQSIGVGTTIAGYRLERLIGVGGMATVYLAERGESGEEAVLKIMREELVGDEDLLQRFLREPRYASSLEHPNIVKVFEAGEANGLHFIAMQYVDGTDLRNLLKEEGPLPAGRAVAILVQVAEALDVAHAAGLLHRDVKPDNVLIAEGAGQEGDKAYLTDFGLGKDPGRDSRALTGSGEFVGTVLYTAPEQMLEKEPDRRVDVYSLACVLYETLVGGPPFHHPNVMEVMQAHIESPPPKASKQRKGLPPELDAVIERGLAKEPGDRYDSCVELVAAAGAALGVQVSRPPAPRGPAHGNLTLVVEEGPAAGARIAVAGELMIGRTAPGEGTLGHDLEISRQHAVISGTPEGGWTIRDLGSTNGTFVNGQETMGDEELRDGDRVELGGTVLTAAIEPAAEAPAAAPATPSQLSVRLVVDLEAGEGALELDRGADPVRIVLSEGRWRLAR